jgi:predicted HTH transcriptional regulator
MTLKELKSLCSNGEGQYVEFKQNINHPDQIVEEVIGFANATGGSLLIGVNDMGELTGLKYAEDDAIFIDAYLNKKIEPAPPFNYDIVPINKKKSIIHLQVRSGDNKPYGFLRGNDKIKKVFYRVDDQCLQASRELKNILRYASSEKGQIIKYTELEDSILKLFNDAACLTKKQIKQKINFNSRKISDCLVRLVTAGVLKIIPAIDDDLYEFNYQS